MASLELSALKQLHRRIATTESQQIAGFSSSIVACRRSMGGAPRLGDITAATVTLRSGFHGAAPEGKGDCRRAGAPPSASTAGTYPKTHTGGPTRRPLPAQARRYSAAENPRRRHTPRAWASHTRRWVAASGLCAIDAGIVSINCGGRGVHGRGRGCGGAYGRTADAASCLVSRSNAPCAPSWTERAAAFELIRINCRKSTQTCRPLLLGKHGFPRQRTPKRRPNCREVEGRAGVHRPRGLRRAGRGPRCGAHETKRAAFGSRAARVASP